MTRTLFLSLNLVFLLLSPTLARTEPLPNFSDPREVHLQNIRQLTQGGENAEAYFSSDAKVLTLQAKKSTDSCDQIYRLPIPANEKEIPKLEPVTQQQGRNTCSYFFPDQKRILFSSTRHVSLDCPPPVDHSKGYVWPLYNYQIYTARPDGTDVKRLSQTSGYEAEATICHDGTIIFTSDRDGDLELYRMKLDGSGLTRLTYSPGYDGGAFFSEDCKHIVWRAAHPKTDKELLEMKDLWKQRLVRPTQLEIWTADADGKNAHAVTNLQAASFAPFFFPARLAGASNKRIIFSSNYGDPKHREFDLWAINSDGTELERITYTQQFDGFPMFSKDGKYLVFSSNRNGTQPGETNVFLAHWKQ